MDTDGAGVSALGDGGKGLMDAQQLVPDSVRQVRRTAPGVGGQRKGRWTSLVTVRMMNND